MQHVLVDTDVILDLILERHPFFPDAARLFMGIQDKQFAGSVSSLVFSNLAYILRKPLSKAGTIGALRKLRLVVGVLPVDEVVIDKALASAFTDFEDAIQYYAAEMGGVDAIITRNKSDFQQALLPVFSSGEWLQHMEAYES